MQGRHLAEAVTAEDVAVEAEVAQQAEGCETGETEGGLGPLRRGEARGLCGAGFVGEHGRREDHPMDCGFLVRIAELESGMVVPCLARGIEGQGEFAAHAHGL